MFCHSISLLLYMQLRMKEWNNTSSILYQSVSVSITRCLWTVARENSFNSKAWPKPTIKKTAPCIHRWLEMTLGDRSGRASKWQMQWWRGKVDMQRMCRTFALYAHPLAPPLSSNQINYSNYSSDISGFSRRLLYHSIEYIIKWTIIYSVFVCTEWWEHITCHLGYWLPMHQICSNIIALQIHLFEHVWENAIMIFSLIIIRPLHSKTNKRFKFAEQNRDFIEQTVISTSQLSVKPL